MSLKIAIPLAFASACLPFASHVHAATYTESGDAGDLPATAQVVSGTSGTSLTAILGSTALTNNISDSDMFEIYISSPGTFSASDTAFVAGSNNFDSQLSIFRVSGLGAADNDDTANGGSQSAIPAGSFTGAPGLYYLLISGSGRYPVSSGGLIFPNYTDGTSDPTTTYGPTGAGGGNAISGYTGSSSEAGNYVIALAGAQFVPAAVPEPGAAAFVAAGAAALAFANRKRRTAKP